MAKNKEKFEDISETRKRVFIMNKLDTVVGNLYEFGYTPDTAHDSHPTILIVYRSSQDRLFSAFSTRDTYFAGINLNNLDIASRVDLLEKYGKKRRVTGAMVKRFKRVYKDQYRVYNQKHVEDFTLIDIDIYLENLQGVNDTFKSYENRSGYIK